MKKLKSAGKSDIGLKRSKNEDLFHIDDQSGFCLVADGMGGAAAGELASLIFAESAREIFFKFSKCLEFKASDLVKKAFETANRKILDHVRQNPQHTGMGCTAELLAFHHDELTLGHIGDSRTYSYFNGILMQLTRDHSLVQQKIDLGQMTYQEAKRHPLRNIILRAVGINETILIDLITITPKEGELFLLCSDGLTNMIDDNQIAGLLASQESMEKKAQKLIELANTAGGDDNITLVLCRLE